MNNNRHPKGTSNGGRFATGSRPEPTPGMGLTGRAPAGSVAERMSAAVSMRPGAAAQGSRDPSKFVQIASLSGWDLGEEDRDRVHADRDVNRILVRIGALSPA